MFTDEKLSNTDRSDGRAYYWSDSCVEPRYFSKHQGGGPGVMFWGAVRNRSVIALSVIDGRIDSKVYTTVLDEALFPKIKQFYKRQWILQIDNAPIHTSKYATDYLSSKKATDLKWLARSPDLNQIENL